MAITKQSSAEKLSTELNHSSNQKGNTHVGDSGIAKPLARGMISQRFDKPVQAMKLSELYENHFKG